MLHRNYIHVWWLQIEPIQLLSPALPSLVNRMSYLAKQASYAALLTFCQNVNDQPGTLNGENKPADEDLLK